HRVRLQCQLIVIAVEGFWQGSDYSRKIRADGSRHRLSKSLWTSASHLEYIGRRRTSMDTAIACVALLALLLFGLGINVSATRGRSQKIGATPTDPRDPLFKAVRAHGNTAEYAPMLAVLMLYLGTHSPAAWVIVTMVVVTACRYLIAAGLLFFPTLDQPNPLRLIGAAGTYFGGIALAIAAL